MNTMTTRSERPLSWWTGIYTLIVVFTVIAFSTSSAQTQQDTIRPKAFSVQNQSLNSSLSTSEINEAAGWIQATDSEPAGLTAAEVDAFIDAVYAGGPAGSTIAAVLFTRETGDLNIVYGDAEGQIPVSLGGFPIPDVGSSDSAICVPAVYQRSGPGFTTGSHTTPPGYSKIVWIILIGFDLDTANDIHAGNELESSGYPSESETWKHPAGADFNRVAAEGQGLQRK